MKNQKINLNFSKFSDPDFLVKARHILSGMTDNPAFADPIPTLKELEAAVTNYAGALDAALGLGRTNVAEKNKCRAVLEALLGRLGMYVMFVANGDAAILTSSGYTLSKTPESAYISNPGNVTLSNGITSGELISSVLNVSGARM